MLGFTHSFLLVNNDHQTTSAEERANQQLFVSAMHVREKKDAARGVEASDEASSSVFFNAPAPAEKQPNNERRGSVSSPKAKK